MRPSGEIAVATLGSSLDRSGPCVKCGPLKTFTSQSCRIVGGGRRRGPACLDLLNFAVLPNLSWSDETVLDLGRPWSVDTIRGNARRHRPTLSRRH